MDQVEALLNLPLSTLVILGAGYLSYRLAYAGLDQHHRSVDTAFISLTFGLIAKLVLELCQDFPIPAQVIIAVITSIICAALWRKWGADWVYETFRHAGVSNSDGLNSAWDRLRVSAKEKPTQLVVRKCDGSVVMCDDLYQFRKRAHGPCVYGRDGSVALYVTHFKANTEAGWEDADPIDEDYGAAITFIPASSIDEIEVRY